MSLIMLFSSNKKKLLCFKLIIGHTFCISCLNQITANKCPKCKAKIEQKATNWALINYINKRKFTPQRVKELETKMFELKKELEEKTCESFDADEDRLTKIREEITQRAEYWEEKLRAHKENLLKLVDEHQKRNEDERKEFRDVHKRDTKKRKAEESYFDEENNIKKRPKKDSLDLHQIKNEIEKKTSELKLKLKQAETKLGVDHFKFITPGDNSMVESMFGSFIESLPTSDLCKTAACTESSKLFILYNEKVNGYLDSSKFKLIYNQKLSEFVDLERDKFDNPNLRWVFVAKDSHFWLHNQKGGRYLVSDKDCHVAQKKHITQRSTSEVLKWEVLYFLMQGKKYVVFKSVKSGKYLNADSYEKNSYTSTDSFYMSTFANGDPRANPDFRFELIEVPLDIINRVSLVLVLG